MQLFETWEDTHKYLSDTVIAYKDQPIYVRGATPGQKGITLIKFNMMPLGIDGSSIVNIEDPEVNYMNLGHYLGYMNIEYNCYREAGYISRAPVRKWHQGLAKANIIAPSLKAPLDKKAGRFSFYWEYVIACQGFIDMFVNKYPTKKDIAVEFNKHPGAVSYAFHRQFAIKRNEIGPLFLCYKGTDIGWTEDMDRIVLDKRFRYLEEVLESNGFDFR